MIKYYKTLNGNVAETERAESGCWVSVVSPNESEIAFIIERFGLDAGFIRSSLDEEESSRIENEEEQTLIIVDYPVSSSENREASNYYTLPMGIILTENCVFTISARENSIISELSGGLVKNMRTDLKTRFVLMLLLRIATKFLLCLKQIDKMSTLTEKNLHKGMRNKELLQMLDLEKSLVYFSTSLKANEVTLEKILRGRVIRMYEEDKDLLEDVLIEVKQAIEMAGIYSTILSGTRDAFASIISNNLNDVMKRLTIITILMAIPTIVFSYYGMNVKYLPFDSSPVPVPLIFAAVVTAITAIVMLKKDE